MTAAPALATGPRRIALIGAPNAGKTTLFNALTGSSARVGNYPGVTVERRAGVLVASDGAIRILDLPGTYALLGETPDEKIVGDVLAGRIADEAIPDALLVVVDGTTLRRGLGLVREVLDLGMPTLLVVTMIDEAKARGGRLDLMKLGRTLGIHVLGVVGHRGVGGEALRTFLKDPAGWPRPRSLPRASGAVDRFAWVDQVAAEVGATTLAPDNRSDRVDRILLHPITGVLVFAAVMILLFQSIFAWAVPAMDTIDAGFTALGRVSRAVLPAGWITDLWADGIVAGVGAVVIFLPQIVILFTFLHVLQDVGYMARAAFVVDRVMGWIGLQGRSFVPLLSCYACAVPGMMAARTIASPRERLATILVSPFMTCSARLPVYTLLIAAFVPAQKAIGPFGVQGLVMLGLYILGAIGLVENVDKYAVLFGAWVAVMELIPYLGPWLGAIPPIIYALAVDPISAIWVALLFLGIHQIEGHIVVPNVMGSALRLHPLLVIFGLLAGAELYGLPGIFVALPFLAVVRAMWEFFGERVRFEPWQEGVVPVEVEVEETRPVKPVPPEEPPEAKVAP